MNHPTTTESEGKYVLRLERLLKSDIHTVWSAISDPEQLKKWYFDFSDQFQPHLHQQFEWYAGPPDGKQWLHRGVITEIIAGQKLAHTWEYPGYAGKALVVWQLSEVDKNTTKLHFTFEILEAFDPKEDALHRRNFEEGWNHIVNIGLPEFLEKGA